MKLMLITLGLLTGCVSPGPVWPVPEGKDVTEMATEACARKMAQMAAPYRATSVGSVAEDTVPLPDGDHFAVTLRTTVEYPNETKTGRVVCIVNARGSVRSIG